MDFAAHLTHAPTAEHWNRVGVEHHHGVAIPLFSLRSESSNGIGEYPDLALLIDWCQEIGFDVIQLLPLNDCGQGVSPYSAISAFALNPLFLGLSLLPHLNDFPFLQEELKGLPKFTQLQKIDYAQVTETKENFLQHYFQHVGPQLLLSDAYLHFVQSAPWLKGYAVFKILKKRHGWSSWETWPKEETHPTSALLDKIAAEEKEEFDWHCLVQFLCDHQLHVMKDYAAQKKVFLMGDIPILVDRESADVWLHQKYFDLHYSAGSPPDFFNKNGQHWGFPIYNWQALAHDHYQWWIERLQWANRYFQIYRIDHIVGFFRIWAIPMDFSTGKNGHFLPHDESLWIDQGQTILWMMLKACRMLPIGEDLGDVTAEVKSCLKALGICGTRVMRWERNWEEHGSFTPLDEYPMIGMTTVSTHDTETLAQWWKTYPIEAEEFANYKGWSYQPKLSREFLREILWDSHHTSSLFHINLLQEYLPLAPGLSWPTPEEERINIPGFVNDSNWTYRLRASLEELNQQETLKHALQEIIR